ncbi:hypothetical protein Hypma_012032 [Hypsizygus marmoreus]|uniref:F-box domain-containing protein n=1 Tax=Hypsizygus marmoreus TaxID=39966 RepID=A0A369JPW2_HYPMA|nr:hypothetical protein Hypma_012032 [Hypsizygus marmoreus]
MAVTTVTKSHEFRHRIETPTSHDQAADKARRQIDQEMQRLEDSLRALKFRRNFLAPISRLPPEILAKIFSFRAAESVEGTNPLEWIRVSHVSRYWRAVALETPSIWGTLVFSRPKWSEEMLKRSKMANLVVKADLMCITPKTFEAVRLALLHGPRIEELQLFAASATLDKLLSGLSFEAPMLQSLSLSVPGYSRFGTDQGFTLPDTVLTGETIYLRRVELTKCNISWDSSLLRGLTHLKIHETSTAFRPTTQQLIDALERMPSLEVLDLQEALPLVQEGAATPAQSARQVVDLPQLQHITLKSSVPECVNIVSRITIPVTTRIHLSCNGTEATGDDFSGIMKIISNHRSVAHSPNDTEVVPQRKTIRVLHVQHEAPISLVVQAWTNLPLVGERPSTADIQLHLSWHHTEETKVDAIAASICRAIPLGQLRSLRLSHVPDMEKATWLRTFGRLPKLQDVHIAGSSAHTFIAALREERPIETLKSPISGCPLSSARRPGLYRRKSLLPPVYFPQLRALAIEDASFEEFKPTPRPFATLKDCLMERCDRKAEIQELTFRMCSHLDHDDISSLDDIIANVDWDGIEQGFTDEDDDYGYEHALDELDADDYGLFFGGYNDSDSDMDFGFPF